MCCSIVGAILLMVLAQASLAQSPLPGNEFVHQYARMGRPTINVFVWGEVATPGIWRVEPDIDLIELLSVARVRQIGVEEPGTSRQFTLRIFREEGGQRREVYTERLERIVGGGGGYPALRDGDILEVAVKRKNTITFRSVTNLIGAASAVALLIIRVSNLD